jgi:ABC-type glycerol-3-phosphate transport system substrate-binding protein
LGVGVLVGLAPLAACGGGGSGSGESANQITVWHYFSEPNQVKVMTDFAKKFEKDHPGKTVKNVYVPYDQMNSKVMSATAAQSGPDVVVFNGADTSTLALGGALAPMDSYWAKFSDKGQFPDSVIHRTNGKIYSVQGYVNLLGLWYNADLLKSLGVEPPHTLDELEAAMAKAKAAGKGGITLSGLPQSQGEWQAYPWLTSQGFDYSNLDERSLAKAFSMVRGWVDKGYLSREAVTWDQTVPFQKFTAGNVAFAENGNWQLGAAKSDANFEYGVVPLPLGASGKVYLGGEGEAIGASSDNKDLAWEYLKETYFDAQGQLIPVNDVGSIPSRRDVASDKAVTGNSLLSPFAHTIAEYGANYPSSAIPPKGVADVELAMGKAWSSVLGGQQSPDAAASDVVRRLQGIVSK